METNHIGRHPFGEDITPTIQLNGRAVLVGSHGRIIGIGNRDGLARHAYLAGSWHPGCCSPDCTVGEPEVSATEHVYRAGAWTVIAP